MKNKKGFTLMEVLLAAMIVGVIGLALAALTTAAMRESGIGRTRALVRNQISYALRQLRNDLNTSDVVEFPGPGDSFLIKMHHIGEDDQDTDNLLGPEGLWTWEATYLYNNSYKQIERAATDSSTGNITTYAGVGTRLVWVGNISKVMKNGVMTSPSFTPYVTTGDTGEVVSRVRVQFVVMVGGSNGTPPVIETVDETFVLPHGYAINYNE